MRSQLAELVEKRVRHEPEAILQVPAPRRTKLVDRTLELNLADLASVTDEVAAQPGVAQLASALDSALPARVRVPEAALAPLLAALWQRRRGEERAGVAVLVDDDETAREVADEAAWYAPAEMVGFVPSRGVAYGSGLEPAPHLVGERARGLGLLEAGGLVAISAAALVERVPPRERRAAALHAERGGELVRDEAVAALVAAGYSRVERVGDRGDLAVRGDILDVFPTTGAEPVRIELFGDEVERISRFSVFTQRSLAELERCDLQPAREARRAPADVEEWTHEEDVPVPNDLVSLAPELIAHGVVCAWQPDRVLDAARDRLAEAAASHSRSARERAYVGEGGGRRPARGRQRARHAPGRHGLRCAEAGAGGPRHQRGRGRAARARTFRPARRGGVSASR